MVYIVENPSGMDDIDFDEETAAERVGNRIRDVRTSIDMTQVELGKRIGLNGDRVQKYENGARKPKKDLLKKIAKELGVEPLAFTDPVVTNDIGVMYALFEMEKIFDAKICRDKNGNLFIQFGNGKTGSVNPYLDEWEKEFQSIKSRLEEVSSIEEKYEILHSYDMWKWNFPKAIIERTNDILEIAEINNALEDNEKSQKQLQDEREELMKRRSLLLKKQKI